MTNLQTFPLIKRGQASLYSAEWKAVVCVNMRETTNQTNKLQQYTVHINRVCCAADSKNWTDSNCCYDIADGTVRWYRVVRVVTGLN